MDIFEISTNVVKGEVSLNFDELKSKLELAIKPYETLIVVEEELSGSKKMLANLRKLKKGLDDKRKQVKKKVLEPYELFETDIKTLNSIIDKGITNLDTQIKSISELKKDIVLDDLNNDNVALNGSNGSMERIYTIKADQEMFTYLDKYLKAMKFDFEFITKGEQ